MITYYQGTVFNVNAQAIVNTVNCTGVMGAGLALECKLRYPAMFADYADKCKAHRFRVGMVDYFQADDALIVNFPTKNYFKYPSRIEWIESGLRNFVETYRLHGIESVAFPKLGTLNGGLDWKEVKPLMEKYLARVDAHVYICLGEMEEAEGLERRMVDYFNGHVDEIIKQLKRVSDAQKDVLKAAVPIRRFWHLSELDSIGEATYAKVFLLCKDAVSDSTPHQISLFDDSPIDVD